MMNLPVGRQAMKLVKEKMLQIGHGAKTINATAQKCTEKNNTVPAYK